MVENGSGNRCERGSVRRTELGREVSGPRLNFVSVTELKAVHLPIQFGRRGEVSRSITTNSASPQLEGCRFALETAALGSRQCVGLKRGMGEWRITVRRRCASLMVCSVQRWRDG